MWNSSKAQETHSQIILFIEMKHKYLYNNLRNHIKFFSWKQFSTTDINKINIPLKNHMKVYFY